MMYRFKSLFVLLLILLFLLFGCAAPKLKLFPDDSDPLREFVLEGKAKDKILLIPIQGVISDAPRKQFLRPKPSMVQEIVSQLQMAKKDKNIKAVLLKVNSPGGTATASDIIYKEILSFKKKTEAKVIVVMMDVAASGGYYLSLGADHIIAHPTTITGSVGAIFIYPKLSGLLDKIGVQMAVNKSGRNKDMGSPFRKNTTEEAKLLQDLADDMVQRFLNLVTKHRDLDSDARDTVSTARIFRAEDALKLGLIDGIGYLTDGIQTAKTMANLPEDAKLIVFRRTEFPNDNIYNPATTQSGIYRQQMVNIDLLGTAPDYGAGVYYLWAPAVK